MNLKIMGFALLFILSSLTACKKAPKLSVSGSVTDFTTHEGIGNITLGVQRSTASWSGTRHDEIMTVTTDAKGNYSLNLNPEEFHEYSIYIKDDLSKYGLVDVSETVNLVTGNNIADFKVKKLINLTVNLVNKSTQNRENFSFKTDDYGVYYYASGNAIVKDTILHFKVPRWSKIELRSLYYASSGPGNPIIEFRKELNTENSDTSLQIINP